jgi:hypothetical protein
MVPQSMTPPGNVVRVVDVVDVDGVLGGIVVTPVTGGGSVLLPPGCPTGGLVQAMATAATAAVPVRAAKSLRRLDGMGFPSMSWIECAASS